MVVTVTASIVPHLSAADLAAIHLWTEQNKRTRQEYARHLAAVDALAVELVCLRCWLDEHEDCNSRAGKAHGARCLCWDMYHPGYDPTIERTDTA